MFTGLQALDRLIRMHLCRCREYDGVHIIECQSITEFCKGVLNAIVFGDLFCLVKTASDHGNGFGTINIFNTIQVF